ncbi:hypothetical protein VTK26DRAFT_1529 [Humicola hyalothermophila]
MRPHASSLTLILSGLALTQAATYNRRNEGNAGIAGPNIASGFMNMFSRLGFQQQTVTETIRQTITVGGAGAVGEIANSTGAATATITEAATTVTATVCPGQAQGAIEGIQGDGSSAAPGGTAAAPVVAVPSGGIGVTIISVPADARKTSAVGTQPAASDPAAAPPAASSGSADANTSLEPLPTQTDANQPSLVPPPGLSTDISGTLRTPPGLENPTSVPMVGAPVPETSELASEPTAGDTATVTGSTTGETATVSETTPTETASDSASTATETASISEPTDTETAAISEPGVTDTATDAISTLAPPPGLASSLTNTLSLGETGNAAAPAAMPNPDGAFGGVPGLIPMPSAAEPVAPPSVTPAIANGAGTGPTIDVSGLTLSSQLNLGNLVQQTSTASP